MSNPVVIEGVRVKDPTATWTQLMNTRRNVLDAKEKWNNGAWITRHANGVDVTMCLANALRFVAYGDVEKPQDYGPEPDSRMPDSERLLLKVINRRYAPDSHYGSIPAFNDEEGRSWEEVVAVLEAAIEAVGPYAKQVIMAVEVMTEEERKDIDGQIRDAEDDIWKEYFSTWLTSHEERGWVTFWDELKTYCKGDRKCEERVLNLR